MIMYLPILLQERKLTNPAKNVNNISSVLVRFETVKRVSNLLNVIYSRLNDPQEDKILSTSY